MIRKKSGQNLSKSALLLYRAPLGEAPKPAVDVWPATQPMKTGKNRKRKSLFKRFLVSRNPSTNLGSISEGFDPSCRLLVGYFFEVRSPERFFLGWRPGDPT